MKTEMKAHAAITTGFRLALVMVAIAGAAAVAGEVTAADLEPHEVLARDILRELIETDTTDRSGDNTAAAEAMRERLLGAGFAGEDVEILAPAPRKGNLIARYRGRKPGLKPLLLLAHLDVVEADEQAWSRDPFAFAEEDGYFYGRGVSDDKDEAAIHVANLIRLSKAGYQPGRDIVLALTADEEGGKYNGVQWLLDSHPQKLDAEYVLNEGGGGVLVGGERHSNEVQLTEKLYQTFVIETASRGGHSSMPTDDNAIHAAADVVRSLREHRFPVRLNPVTEAFFARSVELNSGESRDAMEGILRTPPDRESIDFLAKTPFYNAMMRTTCTPTMVQGGHAENALPQRVTLTVNCRLLPDDSRDRVEQALRSLAGGDASVHRVAAIDLQPQASVRNDVLQVIEQVSRSIWPAVPVIPIMGPGGTDGRFLRNLGIPVFGANGIFIDVEDDRAHAGDERIRVRSFFEGQEFMYRLMRALSE